MSADSANVACSARVNTGWAPTPQGSEDECKTKRPPKCVREVTAQLHRLGHLEAEVLGIRNELNAMGGFDLLSRVNALTQAVLALQGAAIVLVPEEAAHAGEATTQSDEQDISDPVSALSPRFTFMSSPQRDSIKILEHGKRVLEMGHSNQAQTVLIDPPVSTGTHSLELLLDQPGLKYAPYVGFVVDQDFSKEELGIGSYDARLGVEIPLSWGFSLGESCICKTFQPEDADAQEWSQNASSFYASSSYRFWSRTPEYDRSQYRRMTLTADFTSGTLSMCIGTQTVSHSMPPGATSVRFGVTVRCRGSFKILS